MHDGDNCLLLETPSHVDLWELYYINLAHNCYPQYFVRLILDNGPRPVKIWGKSRISIIVLPKASIENKITVGIDKDDLFGKRTGLKSGHRNMQTTQRGLY